MRRDIPLLLTCEAVALLRGWERSRGACLEVMAALTVGMPLYVEEDMRPAPVTDACGRMEVARQLLLSWSRETFPGRRAAPTREHLVRELRELADQPTDRLEIADVLMLAFALADCEGVDPALAVLDKLEIVRSRTWSAPDVDGVVEHVRDGGEDIAKTFGLEGRGMPDERLFRVTFEHRGERPEPPFTTDVRASTKVEAAHHANAAAWGTMWWPARIQEVSEYAEAPKSKEPAPVLATLRRVVNARMQTCAVSRDRAVLAGREIVAHCRQSDVETLEWVLGEIDRIDVPEPDILPTPVDVRE